MRNLTPEECEFIAGGRKIKLAATTYDPETIVVTGSPPPPPPPPYYPPPPPPPYYPPPPVGGGGGGGDPVHTSPGGVTYHYAANLSAAQIAMVDKIVDYGHSHGYNAKEIQIAVNEAFYESSLGTMTSNPSNSAVEGLYQYDAQTWQDLGHGSLDRSSTTDQITAFYQDITRYEGRYATGEQNGSIPNSLDFDDYMEVKHHLGNNCTDWTSPVVGQYEQKSSDLGFGI